MKRSWIRKIAGVAAVAAALVDQTGMGANDYWTNTTASGDFEVGANWSLGVMPGSADRAVFTNRTAYTVNINNPITNAGLDVLGGEVTLSIPGSNLTVTAGLTISNRVAESARTNVLIVSGSTTVKVDNVYTEGQNNGWVGGRHKLVIKQGAKLQVANNIHLGGSAQYSRAVGTSEVIVADAGTFLTNAGAFNMNIEGYNCVYVTNGARITSGSLTMQIGNYGSGGSAASYSKIELGGGTGESRWNWPLAAIINGTFEVLTNESSRIKKAEVILHQGGRIVQTVQSTWNPGSTLTLDGGTYELAGAGLNNIRGCGPYIRGSGTILFSTGGAGSTHIVATNCVNTATSPFQTNSVVFSPGMPGAPIGTTIISNYASGAYVQTDTGGRFYFDIGGTAPSQYDQVLAKNAIFYFGKVANPMTVEGSIINVNLVNGFMPVDGNTFDVLVASNIMNVSLSPLTFVWPSNPDLTWTPAIVTNISGATTNETLRLTVSGGAPKGTLITVW